MTAVITKRNTVNKIYKKDLLTNTKTPRQIAMANPCGKFPRQISAANSRGK